MQKMRYKIGQYLPLILLLSWFPIVHAPSNPAFVLYADNATCGAHCTLTSNGGGTFSNDQWGVWGTSPALIVTSGDFLVVGFINFCISTVATRCDITALSDGLGNVFTCSTIGNNQLVVGASAPVIGASICSSLATVGGTEAATNAFTVTVACGACVIGDQYDSEWIVYEYSNAQRIITGTYVNSVSLQDIINGAITITVDGDAIFGFAYGSSGSRPLTYQDSQTNQHAWIGSTGYPAGDLENLSVGAHNYRMGRSSTPDNIFELITAEISNTAPPSPPESPKPSITASSILVVVLLLIVMLIAYAFYDTPEKGKEIGIFGIVAVTIVGVVFIVFQAMGI